MKWTLPAEAMSHALERVLFALGIPHFLLLPMLKFMPEIFLNTLNSASCKFILEFLPLYKAKDLVFCEWKPLGSKGSSQVLVAALGCAS